jgi:hypothetical protein
VQGLVGEGFIGATWISASHPEPVDHRRIMEK